jgi:hypothetical protein
VTGPHDEPPILPVGTQVVTTVDRRGPAGDFLLRVRLDGRRG